MLTQARISALARHLAFYAVALAIAAADQLSKYLVWQWLTARPAHRVSIVPGVFDLFLQFNTGGAFSLFHDRPLVILVFALVAVAWMIWHVHRLAPHLWLERLALGLIVGGAIGNLIDRLRLGFVIDFFHVYWREWYWPTFNIADSAICVGVALYMFAVLRTRPVRRTPVTKPDVASASTNPGGSDHTDRSSDVRSHEG